MSNTNNNPGIRLLKKGKQGIVHMIFSRAGIIILLLLLNAALLLLPMFWLESSIPLIGVNTVFVIVMVFFLLNSRMDPTAKLTWLFVIMILPLFGALLFWYTQTNMGVRVLKRRSQQLVEQTKESVPRCRRAEENLAAADPGAASLARYLLHSGAFPVFDRTAVTYFPLGEDKWTEMLRQLEQAEHFIFMEYFIINEGLMWGKVLEILARKAAQGVEVRVMYDGMCEFSTLSHDYPKRLANLGIQCKPFAPITPFVSTHYNYRDHRKILVIDGHTAFNGGINLADEYINHVIRFGHWKDTAVMIKGEAVRSFTLLFLQMWGINEPNPEFNRYLTCPIPESESVSGYVIPYGDCPLDEHKIGERVYMDILNRARRYVHIMTPYLILDGEVETALRFAAQRGVDVSLILPGIPDKKIPYALAKTHYASLLSAGVRIYEYTPGFVHAKVFVSDDQEAVVGTINLDYRSLYHHFECATYLNRTDCIPQIEEDFQATLTKCRQITPGHQEKWTTRLTGAVAKAFAPLL